MPYLHPSCSLDVVHVLSQLGRPVPVQVLVTTAAADYICLRPAATYKAVFEPLQQQAAIFAQARDPAAIVTARNLPSMVSPA